MSYSQSDATKIFGQMLDGEMSDSDIRELLIVLADRGETAEEIAGAASAMRARVIGISAPENAVDVCGTGGDGQHSLNISTAVALVVAACGIPVAKHGNRAASSKAGAADTLEALGLDLDGAERTAEGSLADIGICFLFAQRHHPALGRIAPIRKELGRRTIFNFLGPICNPAGVKRQLIGIPSPDLIPTYHKAAELLGTERAMIVSGEEGLDEISIAGPTRIATIGIERLGEAILPEDAGLPRHDLAAIKGGDAAYNAGKLRDLLNGEDGAYRDAVVLNTAASLIASGEDGSLPDLADRAREAIDSGRAKRLLNDWIALAR